MSEASIEFLLVNVPYVLFQYNALGTFLQTVTHSGNKY